MRTRTIDGGGRVPVFVLLAVLLLLTCLLGRCADVPVAWNAYGGDVIGFNLYAGQTSRVYTARQFVPGRTKTNAVASVPGGLWFFSLTATTAGGLESDFSTEVCAIVPDAPDVPALPVVLIFPRLEASTNLANWAAVSNVPPIALPATNAQEFFRVIGLRAVRSNVQN